MGNSVRGFIAAFIAGVSFFSVSSDADDETSTNDAPQWYQVELVIFANDSPAALASENWAAEPVLEYPDAQRFLVDPEFLAGQKSNTQQHVEVDEFGRIIIDKNPSAIPVATAPIEPVVQYDSTDTATDIESGTPPPVSRHAFYLLPPDQLTLTEQVDKLSHSGQRQVIFHKAWQQPISSKATALPIVLDDSGNTNTWPRLQGSVTLYLSRYLHIQTRLWLNTYGNYLQHPTWQMPAPPLGPKSIIVREDESLVSAEQVLSNAASESGNTQLMEEEATDLGPTYPWRHALPMQQSRRMRSRELHYLDHPAMGLLVIISPLEESQ